MVETFGYISVQPDWAVDVKKALSGAEGPHTFWASAYKQGIESLHDTIQITKTDSPTSPLKLTAQSITAEYIDTRHLQLSTTNSSSHPASQNILAPRLYTAPHRSVECSQIKRKTGLRSFDISPYGGLLVGCGDEGVMGVYEIEGRVHRVQLEGHLGDVTACRFFPSGQVVLSGATDMRIKIWSASDGSNPVTLVGHTAAITDLAIIGRGRQVLSAAADGTLRLWLCGEASVVHVFELSRMRINSVALVARFEAQDVLEIDGKLAVAACEDGRVVVVDLMAREVVAEYGDVGGVPVRAVAYDVANSRLYTGMADGSVNVWAAADAGEPVYAFRRNASPVSAIRLVCGADAGEPRICVGTEDGQLFVAAVIDNNGAVGVEIVEELVAFDVDPITQIRTAPSSVKNATRQSIWASGRTNKAYEF
ncbi:Proteasomal ATPase-associated factor 1 [Kickxella alabastrina]|uniref:Proteasomal ATPase-associated factor 1 n=1 Tax=Kickxella alabastrina TaxID=61397 RepID=A0ACC1ILW8_9FUNG|nr:Proteasomal ATPase-associated factor 1 [Kickxella alabastrina]